jgi:alpha-mannosidase
MGYFENTIERKILELMALSVNSAQEINIIYSGRKKIDLPYSSRQSPDTVRNFSFDINTKEMPEPLKYILMVEISGNGIIEFDGIQEQAIDGGHKYTVFNKPVKAVTLKIGTRELFGKNQWHINIQSIKLISIDYNLFVSAINILQIYKSLKYLDNNVKNKMLKYIYNNIIKLYKSPNIMQITAANSIFPDNIGEMGIYSFISDIYGYPVLNGKLVDIGKSTINEKEWLIVNEIINHFKGIDKPERGRAYFFGHCHIDAAWLWPYSETERKVERSFLNAIKIYNSGYKMHFAQSSALYYSWIENKNSDMFSRIKELVNSGLWIPAGGMWVESDTNLIRGESLARQLLYGQSYFFEKFGRYAQIGWLPDSFGFSGQLPQLFIKSGLKAFVTHKPEWNDTRDFPMHCFNWKGIDGTSIITSIVNSTYNGTLDFDTIMNSYNKFKNKNAPMTYLYGYGDGGGGPNIEMMLKLEMAREYKYLPEIENRPESYYISDLTKIKDYISEYNGEIYLETHRGVYTTNFKIKDYVARIEDSLHILEFINSMNYFSGNYLGPERIRELWLPLLKAEFHDVLPGSADQDAYNEVYRELESLIPAIDGELKLGIKNFAKNNGIKSGLLAINTNINDFTGFVCLPEELKHGNLKPIKAGNDEFIYVHVPGCGYSIVEGSYDFNPVKIFERKNSFAMLNNKIKAVIYKDGTVSVFKPGGEKIIKKGNIVRIYNDIPEHFDAWNIDYISLKSNEFLPCTETIVEPLNKSIIGMFQIKRVYQDGSSIIQTIALKPESEFLEFENRIIMKNREKLVKTLFEPDYSVEYITREIPFGAVEYKPDKEAKKSQFEFPALRYINCKGEDKSFSIMSRHSHGYSYIGKTIGISLGKFPLYPNPFSDAEEYTEKFYVSVDLTDNKLSKLSESLFDPVKLSYTGDSNGTNIYNNLISFTGGETIKLENIKVAENYSGIILRLYNNSEKEAMLKLNLQYGFSASELNIIESCKRPCSPELKFTPFEIKTVLIEEREK